MWIVGALFGIVVAILGIWLIGVVGDAPTVIRVADRGEIESSHAGVAVLLVGIAIACFSLFVARGFGGLDRARVEPYLPPRGVATTREPSSAPTTTTSAPTDETSIDARPTNTSPTETPLTQTSPRTTDGSVAGTGPWVGTDQGVQLVVSHLDRVRKLEGRVRVWFRLENGSDNNVYFTTSSFLAVDEHDDNYRGDYANSDWEADLTLEAGERKDGYIVLADKLSRDANTLRIEFNVSQDTYFTVATTVTVPSGQQG